jgi:hypothetical protein
MSTDILKDLAGAADARRPPPKHPEGWEPGVAWDGAKGTITAPSDSKLPDWRGLLAMWDFDPDQYEVIEPVQVRTWDAAIGNGEVRRMWYHRANIRLRVARADVDELIARVRRRKPKVAKGPSEPIAYFLALNDWQLGKRGTPSTIDRITAAVDASAKRARSLGPEKIILAGLGDMVESCDEHYPMQRFQVELDSAAQRRLARELIDYAVEAHRGLADWLLVPVVAGNHGENNRKDGKATTTFADNSDLEVFEHVAFAHTKNPGAYDRVAFNIAGENLTLAFQPLADGPIVGLAHGHQAKYGGTTAQQKVASWWKDQAFGQQPVGDADILVTAHNHHLSVIEHGARRWHFQASTEDSGSDWFTETAGVESSPSMLSFVIVRGRLRPWDDLKLL